MSTKNRTQKYPRTKQRSLYDTNPNIGLSHSLKLTLCFAPEILPSQKTTRIRTIKMTIHVYCLIPARWVIQWSLPIHDCLWVMGHQWPVLFRYSDALKPPKCVAKWCPQCLSYIRSLQLSRERESHWDGFRNPLKRMKWKWSKIHFEPPKLNMLNWLSLLLTNLEFPVLTTTPHQK